MQRSIRSFLFIGACEFSGYGGYDHFSNERGRKPSTRV